jgi:ADP-ribose pyrophosphatase
VSTPFRLGAPAAVTVDVLDAALVEGTDRGFLRVRRLTLQNRYPDGSKSAVYRYDVVERDAIDAVAVVLEADGEAGPSVCLRSSLRPSLALRRGYALPVDEAATPVLWELPAGLVEAEERGESGLAACASRETLEEVGLAVRPEEFRRLGPPFFLSPGVVGEKVHLFVAKVDPSRVGTALGDGSPAEEFSESVFVPLEEALAATCDGRIEDVKTEVGLHRLARQRGIPG